MKFDSLHAVLLVACMGLAFNVGMLLAEKCDSSPKWKFNENAMQEACQENPNLLVCNLSKESK